MPCTSSAYYEAKIVTCTDNVGLCEHAERAACAAAGGGSRAAAAATNRGASVQPCMLSTALSHSNSPNRKPARLAKPDMSHNMILLCVAALYSTQIMCSVIMVIYGINRAIPAAAPGKARNSCCGKEPVPELGALLIAWGIHLEDRNTA